MELTVSYLTVLSLTYSLTLAATQYYEDGRLLFERKQFPGSKSFKTYEEIQPQLFYKKRRIYSTLRGNKHIRNVTIYFKAFGRRFILDLVLNKHLFSSSYIEKRHHSFGIHKHQPQVNNHCFYHGNVRGDVNSLVAISTCDNIFHGLISDDIDTYHIEEFNKQHRIYKDKDKLQNLFKCGNDHGSHMDFNPILNSRDSHSRKRRSVKGPYDGNDNTRFVELYLVNDQRTFLDHNASSSYVIKRSQDIVNIVSRLYRSLNIYVALVGVEVWENRDLISITPSPDITLENFLRYRRERINPFHTNDNAQLITGTKFDEGVVGKAIKGRICTFQFSGGVNYDYDGLTTLATTVAHELGHSFGMEHDNDSYCHCPDSKCIMAATSGSTSPTQWSSCSKVALQESFEIGMDYCLRNKPEKIFAGPVCGNGLVEEGEICDCGLPQDCANRCCNATTCKLIAQATCGTGRCCNIDTCQFKEAATLCRSPNGECDLAEFCSGASEYCPDDIYKQNGLSCADSQSYCYEGNCNTHSSQCKLLWGSTGRASDPICYQQLNMQGTHDGNCGYNWTRSYYTRCHREDVMCGLLHCVHLNEKLMFWRDSLAHTMRASFLTRGNTQYVCRSAMLDVGIDMPDPGMVPDGAKCEEDKICVSQKCVPIAKLPVAECHTNCDNHGVCNSKGNCHCEIGYAPPLCNKPGYGGSIDSGPASNEYVNIKLLVGLLVFFMLLLLGIIIFLLYFYRQRIHKWWKTVPQFQAPMKPIFKKPSSDNNTKRPATSISHQRVVPPPQTDPSQPILSNSANRKSKVVISNPSQQKPLVPKHESRPKSPINKYKNRDEPATSRFTPAEKFKKPDPVDKMPKFVPENKIFKPEPKTNTQATSSKPKEPAPISWKDVPLPPKPVTTPKSEKKAIIEKKPNPPVVQPLSPKSERLMKRESFTGADISHPVLVSTTNRNSNMFDDLPDTLPRGSHISRSPSARGPPPIPPHGQKVKRSMSDRTPTHRSPVRPAYLATQEEEEASAGNRPAKSVLDKVISPPVAGGVPRSRSPAATASFRSKSPPSRPLPPEPRVQLPPKPNMEENIPSENSGVYMNSPAVICGDLLDDINQYLNNHTIDDKNPDQPVTYTNIPDGSKASELSNKKTENKPSQVAPVNKFSRSRNPVTKDTKTDKPGLKTPSSSVSKAQRDVKPVIAKNKPELQKTGVNRTTTQSKNQTVPKSVAKPGEKSHVSRVNSPTKPATPPKSAAVRAKSPTGVTRSASQVTALAAKFSKEQSQDTAPSTEIKPTANRAINKAKPTAKKVQSFNV